MAIDAPAQEIGVPIHMSITGALHPQSGPMADFLESYASSSSDSPSPASSCEGAKRKRIVVKPPTSDYCRQCRSRKQKCDGQRPSCGRCVSAGRRCSGFAIFDLRLGPDPQAAPNCSTLNSIDDGQVSRAQLLSQLIARHYPANNLAAPYPAHHSGWSFLHCLADSPTSSALLRSVSETLSLSYLSDVVKGQCIVIPLQRSRTHLLGLLRSAIARCERTRMCSDQRDIVAATIALSMVPQMRTHADEVTDQPSVHLLGAADFLRQTGPPAGEHLESALLHHIHCYSSYVAFARRKKIDWEIKGWQTEPNLLVAPKPVFPAIARFIPDHFAETEFVQFQFCARSFMVDFVLSLPGLLERADSFVQASPSTNTLAEFEDLVQRLNIWPAHLIRPSHGHSHNGSQKLHVVSVKDRSAFDIGIEEHAFMLSNTTFKEFYSFPTVEQGFNTAFVHQLFLLADCALLGIIHHACQETSELARSVGGYGQARILGIERRASWHASELCRCAHFYSQRTLTGAKFLDSMLGCARNFFESYGAVEEATWCGACSKATIARIARLQAKHPPSLCRVVDMAAELPKGCSYIPHPLRAVDASTEGFAQLPHSKL